MLACKGTRPLGGRARGFALRAAVYERAASELVLRSGRC
jgi:hypothetical protein